LYEGHFVEPGSLPYLVAHVCEHLIRRVEIRKRQHREIQAHLILQ